MEISEQQRQAAEYMAQQKYSEAITLYEQNVEAEPTVMSNYWHLGLALLLQGQESEAQMTWLSALSQVSPEQTESATAELVKLLEAEAQCRCEADLELENAWAIRQYIREFDPDNLNNLLAMVLLPIEIGDFFLEGKLALSDATKLLSSGQYREVNVALVVQVLEKINPLISDNNIFIEESFKYLTINDEFDKLYKIQYKYAQEYYYVAVNSMAQGRLDEAVSCFEKALELNTKIPEIHFQFGMTLVKQCRYEEGLSCFYKVLEISPDFEQAKNVISTIEPYFNQVKLKGYDFTGDWLSENIQPWQQHLSHLPQIPNINALEIGSCEGASACWFLDNILTDEFAKLTCIDLFHIPPYEKKFDSNIAKTGVSHKVEKIKGKSQEVLRSLSFDTYDMLYIDGSHVACDILEDAVLSWRLIKVGGIIIFDDYDYIYIRQASCDAKNNTFAGLSSNPSWNSKVGIDAFITVFEDKIKILHKGHQVILEKTAT